ncbi:MAG: hypothetical protein QXH51_07920 [Candidatus Bathyarchaeia archaeon]
MDVAEAAGLALIGSGVAAIFLSFFGCGDSEVGKWLIVSGIALIGGYAYGLYRYMRENLSI